MGLGKGGLIGMPLILKGEKWDTPHAKRKNGVIYFPMQKKVISRNIKKMQSRSHLLVLAVSCKYKMLTAISCWFNHLLT